MLVVLLLTALEILAVILVLKVIGIFFPKIAGCLWVLAFIAIGGLIAFAVLNN